MSQILAIDDNRDNLVTITAQLKLFIPNCDIITAQSGEQGIQLAIKNQPDIILLDVHMPGIDGFETCKLLKANAETSHIPVIILTAIRTDSKSRVKALELGADAFLSKPIDESELAAQVKAMLRIKRAEDKLRNENEHLEEMVAQRVEDLSISNKQLRREMEERKRAQYELEMKSNAIENSLNGFDIVDQDLRLIYVNKAYVKMWGYDRSEEVIGTSPIDHCLDSGIPQKIISTLKKDGKCKIEFTGKKKDGSEFDVLMYAHLAHDANGNEIYPSASVDVTNRKQAEKEKLQLEKQLIQAQKMEAIGNLAGGIAHDFNNILSSILGFTELALEDVPEGSPIKDNLDEVYIAGNRAKELVQQILAFARQSEELKKPVKLNEIVIEALKLLRPSTPTTIDIIPAIKSIATVRGNVSQLHQIVMNLCTNAIHSLQEKGGVLEIALKDVIYYNDLRSTHSGLPAGKYVELTIADNGPGIDPAIIDNIFEPYFTTKSVGEGTGMGLSMVKGIIESHDGDIQVQSEPGQKTAFTIQLPVEAVERLTVIDQIDHLVSKGTESILFVDDEAPIARMGSRMLSGLGYKVKSETSSIEALELFRSNPDAFDLMITDMTMPTMTGDILAKEIRKIKPNIPIILCTGYSNKINKQQANGLGINAFAYKPFTKADLANTVREVLDASLK